ncbi:uncharacterized protein [Oryctolagus cuniculus]|uniref:uncharacterized protein isoform X3 n=1 Tax=Oryctolagus cuniculus TaxID=9986 RepID=UPI00387A73DD
MGRHTKREAQPTLLAVRPDTERYLPGIMAETARGLSTVFPETLLRRDPDTRRGRLPGNPPRGYHGDPHFRPGPRPPRRAGSGVRAPGWGDLPGPGRRRLPTSQTQRGEAVRRCGRAEAGRIGAMTTATSAPGQGPPSDRTHVRPPVQEGIHRSLARAETHRPARGSPTELGVSPLSFVCCQCHCPETAVAWTLAAQCELHESQDPI